MAEKMITIGAGKMGRLIAGENAVSVRQTSSFTEKLDGKELVLLATRQEDGLRWLRNQSTLLSGKIIISLMAFVNFESLETAVKNDQVRFVRIMTDTSLKTISWSDDGHCSYGQLARLWAASPFRLDETAFQYLGPRKDEDLLTETIGACRLGWTAQVLAEITSIMGEDVLLKALEQRQKGLSFDEIAKAVATSGGATEAGIVKTRGLFAEQLDAGLEKAKEKSEHLLNFAKQLV